MSKTDYEPSIQPGLVSHPRVSRLLLRTMECASAGRRTVSLGMARMLTVDQEAPTSTTTLLAAPVPFRYRDLSVTVSVTMDRPGSAFRRWPNQRR